MVGRGKAQIVSHPIFALLICPLALWLAFPAPVRAQNAPAQAPAKNSCLDCHQQLPQPVHINAAGFAAGIHASKGISCANCHGGDPTTDDMARAMSPAAGFKGHIDRRQIPKLCSSCHSNAAYMRGFNPSLRTDQYSQYLTSVHGKRLAKGDTKVAVCTDCHGLHGILAPKDPRSSVYPLNVAKTCAHCHADASYMRPYGIPTDQYASYTASAHYEDLTVRGDLSAPTCATCHGNHGAAPPGVSSVVNVCATCHVFQAQLFDKSPHKAAFDAAQLPGCVVCHSNHRIVHPTDAFVGTGKGAVCTTCHTQGDPGFIAAAKIHKDITSLADAIQRSNRILNRAESSGMEVSAAKLQQSGATDALMKARVSIHNFSVAPVEKNTQAGLAITKKTYQAGVDALKERDYRRRGLAVSLIAILLVVIGLGMYIRRMEARAHQEARK